MAKKNNRQARRRRARARANNNSRYTSGDPLLAPGGEVRSFHVSGGVVKSSKWFHIGPSTFDSLKRELDGIAEYKVLNARFTWEPLVGPFGDHGVVGLATAPTGTLAKSLPTDVDNLLRAGMVLKPPSTRRSAQYSNPAVGTSWYTADDQNTGGVYVYCSKPGSGDLGRLTGVLTIRVRGIGASL
jgi:hypothetical protein